MTSAAYIVGRDSVAEVTAEGCQARFFLERNINRRAYRGKIRSMARPVGEGRSRVWEGRFTTGAAAKACLQTVY